MYNNIIDKKIIVIKTNQLATITRGMNIIQNIIITYVILYKLFDAVFVN